jgi:hypothetical protein
MSWSRIIAVVGLAGLLLAGALLEVALAQGFGAPAAARFFRVEVGPGKPWRGKDTVSGYVYNDYGQPAANVTLVVHSVDASGAIVDRTTVSVDRIIPPFGRADFFAPVSTPGVKYTGTVLYFDWLKGGGGQ